MPTNSSNKKQINVRATREIDEDQLANIHATVCMIVTVAQQLVPDQYRLYQEDADNIFLPLERIYLRHSETGVFNPDLIDMALFILGVSLYAQRIGFIGSTLSKAKNIARGNGRIGNKPVAPSATNSGVRSQGTNTASQTNSNGSGEQSDGSAAGFRTANESMAALYDAVKEHV